MTHFLSLWNTFNILCFWLFISYCECAQNESQIYPYYIMKCCESKGNPSADGNSISSHGGPTGSCGSEGSEFLFLPSRFFPEMSTDFPQVEVKLWNLAEELKCNVGYDYLDIFIDIADNVTSSLVSAGGKKGFHDVEFLGPNFLSPDGIIYDQSQFCVTSRTSNKTHLAIKTCGRPKCRKTECIPRCCGGDQSILTSPPPFYNESLLEFCSTPTLGKKPWSLWTSDILRIENRSDVFQTRYAPPIEGNVRQSDLLVQCWRFSVTLEDEASLTYLRDGRLQLTLKNTTRMLENFCIDGINVGDEENSSEGNRETPEEKELVVYSCVHLLESISLPTCSDLDQPHDQLLQLPPSLFPKMTLETKDTVAVRLTPGKNNGHMNCPWGHENRILFFSSSEKQFIDNNGGLFLQEVYYTQSEFCVHTWSDTRVDLRVCSEEVKTTSDETSILKRWWEWLLEIILMPLAIMLTVLFHLAIAVVYILRKDKEPVFRCSIVAYSFSMAFFLFLTQCILYLSRQNIHMGVSFVRALSFFFYIYGSFWMCVLCFDVWLNITFLRPGRKSEKRLWCYIALTFTLPVCGFVISYYEKENPISIVGSVLDWLLVGSVIGLICINFLLFLATALKLCIVQHSSDIKNQRNTFLLYFKLFLLVGVRWVIDFFVFWGNQTRTLSLLYLSYLLWFLHPIVLFFFLVWNEETKRYLETNYPRVKSALDFIGGIGYPARKCCGLYRRCKQPEDEETSGTSGAIEGPLCSTHMYVHTRRVPNIPK